MGIFLLEGFAKVGSVYLYMGLAILGSTFSMVSKGIPQLLIWFADLENCSCRFEDDANAVANLGKLTQS